MSDLETVYYNGTRFLIFQTVLDEMGLQAGQSITKEQVRKCAELNLAVLVCNLDIRRIAGEEGVPDTSKMKKQLKAIRTRK